MGWLNFLLEATGAKLAKPKAAGLGDYVILGTTFQGYLTGQKIPSKRPVTRIQYRARSKYKPHQGRAECERRVRQGLAG